MGFIGKIAQGLAKTREKVAKEVMGAIGRGVLTEEILEELEERLVASDISLELADMILMGVKEKARGAAITNQQLLEWMAEVSQWLIPDNAPKDLEHKPHVIMMIGVNGSGKTTTIAKLAHHYKSMGKKVLLAAGDTFRAGAIAQLETWAERVGVDVVRHKEGSDAASVVFDSYSAAKSRGMDVLIIDTAGRLHNKAHLMEELKKIIRVLKKHDESLPHESLLVVDGNTGQNAIQQGKGFHSILPLTGLVITKLDGTAKGGAVLSICRELDIPVDWIGVGEALDDLVPFSKSEYVRSLFLSEPSIS